MSIDILQPLSKRDVPKLLEVLSREMPESSWVLSNFQILSNFINLRRQVQVINWIKTQCKWAEKLLRVRVLILCPYGDWTTGTVVAFNIGLVNILLYAVNICD
jgi:hypothetical protein